MRPFTFDSAATPREAIETALAWNGSGNGTARFLAGGTTLIDLMKLDVMRPERLIDINALGSSDFGRIAFGERRERFPNAAAFQKYVGVAPVTERSGNQSWVHWRFSCSTFIRQTLVEWTEQTIPTSFWAKAFYERHRAKGASHNAAVRALAFKWIRVLWRCWVDRVPYDESRYLSALRRRGSPLLAFAAQNSS